MDEFKRIRKIQSQLRTSSRVLVGIGDDTAVCKPFKGKSLLTVDAMVEGIHFDFAYTSPEALGHKSLAVNLSDIAAMGGAPRFALVSLGCPKKITDRFLIRFYAGMQSLASQHHVDIVGGNFSRADKFFVDVTVVGESLKPKLRSSAKLGDLVVLTGFVGDSAMGYELLKRKKRRGARRLIESHLMPQPRLDISPILSKFLGVHAMIDVSDGLASEAHHIARASKCALEIERDWIPISVEAQQVAKRLKLKALDKALFGGEDYELLFTVAPRELKKVQRAIRRTGNNLVVVGEVKKGSGVFLRSGKKKRRLKAAGWNHFR